MTQTTRARIRTHPISAPPPTAEPNAVAIPSTTKRGSAESLSAVNGLPKVAIVLRPRVTYHAPNKRRRDQEWHDPFPSARIQQDVEPDQAEHEQAVPGGHDRDDQESRRGRRPARSRQRRDVIEEKEGAQAHRGGPDEPDLGAPEQVLEAAPEEEDDQGDADRDPRERAAPNERVHEERDRHMEDREQCQVRDVGAHPDQPEQRPVDEDRDRQPMLVERPHEVLGRDRRGPR